MLWGCLFEKEELATYQLNDVAQVCYEQWKDERPRYRRLDYLDRFTLLYKHAPTIVVDFRTKMNKLIMGVFDLVVN